MPVFRGKGDIESPEPEKSRPMRRGHGNVPEFDAEAPAVAATPVEDEARAGGAEDTGSWVESDCAMGWEYHWKDKGKEYRYYVDGETVKTKDEHNQEFLGGNRHFVSRYRGYVLTYTNDPRLQKQVEKDPGPQVWAKGPTGVVKVMTVPEFLRVINKANAKRRWVYGQR